MVTLLHGDCRERLLELPGGSVHCVVTSPPYWGLRDYGVGSQIGLEQRFDEWLDEMGEVFRQVYRVLRGDGTCWVNMGDSYAVGSESGFKAKDIVGQPWRLAFALQSAGWYLRQDIVWHKPNPMPESVRDRCTKAHECLFLLTKSPRYYWDFDAMQEPVSPNTHARLSQNIAAQIGSFRANGGGKTNGPMKAVGRKASKGVPGREKSNASFAASVCLEVTHRNKRSVWTVPSEACSEAHFATFPQALITPCILAGCPSGGTVLDPFGGTGTTAVVAERCGRHSIMIELDPEYVAIARWRTAQASLFFSDNPQPTLTHEGPSPETQEPGRPTATAFVRPGGTDAAES